MQWHGLLLVMWAEWGRIGKAGGMSEVEGGQHLAQAIYSGCTIASGGSQHAPFVSLDLSS